MKNMKIPVENNLDEIVGELERLGRKYLVVAQVFEGVGFVMISQLDIHDRPYLVPVFNTTLAELKEM